MPTNESNDAPAKSSQRSPWPADIGSQLRFLVRSAEPAVVFTSLAHLCVPTFSEGCTVGIVEDDEAAYQISYPCSDLVAATSTRNRAGARHRQADNAYAVRTRFASVGYTGIMTHLWHTRAPTPAEASRASILVRYGVDTVRAEREQDRRRGQDSVSRLGVVADTASNLDPTESAGGLDPAVTALLQARARRLRYWARCETQHLAGT